MKDILFFRTIFSEISFIKVLFLIPVNSIFSIIGFSTKSIFRVPLVRLILISLKKFESYSLLRELFKLELLKFSFKEIFPSTKIV